MLQTILGNEVITGVIVAILAFVVYGIVKWTKTKKDDAILAMIVNAFNRAESIIPDKTGPVWLQKTDAALKVFKEQYAKREGKEPTEGLVQFAQDQWALLANELKKK